MSVTPRIVSLLPSSTEILCALELTENLVGISHECDYPPQVTTRPRLTAPTINPHGTGRRIDQDVRTLVQQGLSVYQIDTALLQELRPDLIVTQDQWEVCAVPYREVLGAVQQVLGPHVEVVALRPALLQDIWDDIRHLGQRTGRQRQAEQLLADLFARVQSIVAESMTIQQPPRVAVIEWIDPLMMAGNWVPELIQIAGGRDGLCVPGEHSSPITWQTLLDYAPEVLAIIPRGYTLPQTMAAVPRLQGLPDWERLPAVQQGRVYVVDGKAYFNRPGPRIVDSLEILAGVIHPALFDGYLAHAAEVYQRLP